MLPHERPCDVMIHVTLGEQVGRRWPADVNPLYPSGTAYASLGNVLFRAFSTANFALHPQVSERRANFGGRDSVTTSL